MRSNSAGRRDEALAVLRHAKAVSPETYTKSSIIVGLGETRDEVLETMRALRAVDVDVLTLGQYLRPTPKHHELVRYWTPEEFDALRDEGLAMGFRYVASGPLVRSSYRAAEAFLRGLLTKTTGPVESSAARPHRSLPVLP